MSTTLAYTSQLAPSPGLMARVGVWVLGLHGVALWLWVVGVQPTQVVKRPDISIEFYVPPAIQAVAAPEAAEAPDAPAPEGLAAPNVRPVQPPKPREAPRPRPPAPQAEAAPAAAPKPGEAATLSAATIQPNMGTDARGNEQPADTAAAAAVEPAQTEPAPQAAIQTATTLDADYKAAYLNNPKPPYPASAVRRGAEGRVVLLAEVLADGRAGRVNLEQSSGHAILDASAMNTVRTWRFTPARKDGVIVTQTVRIPIEFNLREAR